ncbi:MAG TPA: hypothetical protein VG650_01665 [Mycobacteriales bacterium]|nr:hypothetical protein [Mycobacteriales bacterium]
MSGNAQAFGFSITITATYGVVAAAQGNPSLPEIFGFALAAVASFSALNLLVVALLDRQPTRDPDRVVLLATATDFLAVGSGLAGAVGMRYAITGWGAWVAAPLTAAFLYVLVQTLEIAVGLRQDQTRNPDPGRSGPPQAPF